MVYDSRRHKTIVFGGVSGQKILGDTWEFDGSTWAKVSDDGPGRMAMGYAFDSKRGVLVVNGGASSNAIVGDTWSWDGTQWKQLAQDGPPKRMMGYMAYDRKRDKVVLFGGRLGWPNDANDTWVWDGIKWNEAK
jgi:hypothetical protein